MAKQKKNKKDGESSSTPRLDETTPGSTGPSEPVLPSDNPGPVMPRKLDPKSDPPAQRSKKDVPPERDNSPTKDDPVAVPPQAEPEARPKQSGPAPVPPNKTELETDPAGNDPKNTPAGREGILLDTPNIEEGEEKVTTLLAWPQIQYSGTPTFMSSTQIGTICTVLGHLHTDMIASMSDINHEEQPYWKNPEDFYDYVMEINHRTSDSMHTDLGEWASKETENIIQTGLDLIRSNTIVIHANKFVTALAGMKAAATIPIVITLYDAAARYVTFGAKGIPKAPAQRGQPAWSGVSVPIGSQPIKGAAFAQPYAPGGALVATCSATVYQTGTKHSVCMKSYGKVSFSVLYRNVQYDVSDVVGRITREFKETLTKADRLEIEVISVPELDEAVPGGLYTDGPQAMKMFRMQSISLDQFTSHLQKILTSGAKITSSMSGWRSHMVAATTSLISAMKPELSCLPAESGADTMWIVIDSGRTIFDRDHTTRTRGSCRGTFYLWAGGQPYLRLVAQTSSPFFSDISLTCPDLTRDQKEQALKLVGVKHELHGWGICLIATTRVLFSDLCAMLMIRAEMRAAKVLGSLMNWVVPTHANPLLKAPITKSKYTRPLTIAPSYIEWHSGIVMVAMITDMFMSVSYETIAELVNTTLDMRMEVFDMPSYMTVARTTSISRTSIISLLSPFMSATPIPSLRAILCQYPYTGMVRFEDLSTIDMAKPEAVLTILDQLLFLAYCPPVFTKLTFMVKITALAEALFKIGGRAAIADCYYDVKRSLSSVHLRELGVPEAVIAELEKKPTTTAERDRQDELLRQYVDRSRWSPESIDPSADRCTEYNIPYCCVTIPAATGPVTRLIRALMHDGSKRSPQKTYYATSHPYNASKVISAGVIGVSPFEQVAKVYREKKMLPRAGNTIRYQKVLTIALDIVASLIVVKDQQLSATELAKRTESKMAYLDMFAYSANRLMDQIFMSMPVICPMKPAKLPLPPMHDAGANPILQVQVSKIAKKPSMATTLPVGGGWALGFCASDQRWTIPALSYLNYVQPVLGYAELGEVIELVRAFCQFLIQTGYIVGHMNRQELKSVLAVMMKFFGKRFLGGLSLLYSFLAIWKNDPIITWTAFTEHRYVAGFNNVYTEQMLGDSLQIDFDVATSYLCSNPTLISSAQGVYFEENTVLYPEESVRQRKQFTEWCEWCADPQLHRVVSGRWFTLKGADMEVLVFRPSLQLYELNPDKWRDRYTREIQGGARRIDLHSMRWPMVDPAIQARYPNVDPYDITSHPAEYIVDWVDPFVDIIHLDMEIFGSMGILMMHWINQYWSTELIPRVYYDGICNVNFKAIKDRYIIPKPDIIIPEALDFPTIEVPYVIPSEAPTSRPPISEADYWATCVVEGNYPLFSRMSTTVPSKDTPHMFDKRTGTYGIYPWRPFLHGPEPLGSRFIGAQLVNTWSFQHPFCIAIHPIDDFAKAVETRTVTLVHPRVDVASSSMT